MSPPGPPQRSGLASTQPVSPEHVSLQLPLAQTPHVYTHTPPASNDHPPCPQQKIPASPSLTHPQPGSTPQASPWPPPSSILLCPLPALPSHAQGCQLCPGGWQARGWREPPSLLALVPRGSQNRGAVSGLTRCAPAPSPPFSQRERSPC